MSKNYLDLIEEPEDTSYDAYDLLLFYKNLCIEKNDSKREWWFNISPHCKHTHHMNELIDFCAKVKLPPTSYIEAQVDQALYEKKPFIPPSHLISSWGIDRFKRVQRRVRDMNIPSISHNGNDYCKVDLSQLNQFSQLTGDELKKPLKSPGLIPTRVKCLFETDHAPICFRDLSGLWRIWHEQNMGGKYTPKRLNYNHVTQTKFEELFPADSLVMI